MFCYSCFLSFWSLVYNMVCLLSLFQCAVFIGFFCFYLCLLAHCLFLHDPYLVLIIFTFLRLPIALTPFVTKLCFVILVFFFWSPACLLYCCFIHLLASVPCCRLYVIHVSDVACILIGFFFQLTFLVLPIILLLYGFLSRSTWLCAFFPDFSHSFLYTMQEVKSCHFIILSEKH